MKAIQFKINEEETVGIELSGVVSMIVMYHNGETTFTVSGLRDGSSGSKEQVKWLDRELKDTDSINIRINKDLVINNEPEITRVLNQDEHNEQLLRNYYALKKDLESKNLI